MRFCPLPQKAIRNDIAYLLQIFSIIRGTHNLFYLVGSGRSAEYP